MTTNPYIGSSLDDLLEEDGVLEEVEAIAKKRILSWHSNQPKLLVHRVKIGSLEVDGFMLPDGSYRMSQTQAAECIETSTQNASNFLQSKAIKTLLGEAYTPQVFEIESDSQSRGQSRFRALPLEVVSAFWYWQATRGNKKAFLLGWSLQTESLERRFDTAFSVSRTEQERNKSLTIRVQQLERDLSNLGEAFAIDDQIKSERDYFERLLLEQGIDPWALPDESQNQ